MNAIFLTMFVSAVLSVGGLLLYTFVLSERHQDHSVRLSLLPLEDDASAAQAAPALGAKEGTP